MNAVRFCMLIVVLSLALQASGQAVSPVLEGWQMQDVAKVQAPGAEVSAAKYPQTLANRYGAIRNLADFVRKAQLANYEAFRAMYEGRNAKMFTDATGVLTWMSHPAQPSFVWQLYHYDLEPNAALFATRKASEMIHIQLNEADRDVEVVNNLPTALHGLKVVQTTYNLNGEVDKRLTVPVESVDASSTRKIYVLSVNPHISELYFIKLDLLDADGKLLSTNFYWQNVAQEAFGGLAGLPVVSLGVDATSRTEGDRTILDVTISNPTPHIALMTHLQLHSKNTGERVLPVFYSDYYLSLAPGESRTVTIEAATKQLAGGPLLAVDGYNVTVAPQNGPVPVQLNENAQPSHWSASDLVRAAPEGTK